MKKYLKKIKSKTFIATLFSLLALPKISLAFLGFSGGSEWLAWFIDSIISIFHTIIGAFVTFGGMLVNFSLEINQKMIGSVENIEANNRVVEIGWQVARDVANLGFVLAIIIIALATILRFKDYGAKKLLPKLIAAALIVNFSLAIAGAILNFSDSITVFFLEDQISQGASSIGENITAAFGPQKFFSDTSSEEGPPPGGESSVLAAAANSATSGIFIIVFSLIAFLTLLGLAIMLIIRFVFISVLLILAPIAWLFWVIPKLEDQFHKWWKQFLRWSFFAPAVSFFIYLTLVSVEKLSSTTSAGTFAGAGPLQGIIAQGSQMIIVVGLMLGGLIAADKMGIKGAKIGIDVAQGAGDKIKGYAQNRVKRTRDKALTAGTDESGKTAAQRLAENETMQKIPGVNRALRGIAGASSNAQERIEDTVGEEKEKHENESGTNVANRINKSTGIMSKEKLAALGSLAAEKGSFDQIRSDKKDDVIKALNDTKSYKGVLEKRPDMAEKFGEDIKGFMSKMSSNKASDIDAESFDSSEEEGHVQQAMDVVVNLSNSHLGKIGSEGTKTQKDKIEDTLKKIEESGSEDQKKELNRIRKYMQDNANWQVEENENSEENSSDLDPTEFIK